ncbi:MAG: hypothetical protein JXN59_12550, partial [Anaerolineae bacterium]|nr:hypothetical protein [Anaerolineae bacterium]
MCRSFFRLLLAGMLASVVAISRPVHAQGNVITYGDNVFGSLTAESPFAAYSFAGAAGDHVTVQIMGASPGMLPAVSLLSPAQQQLAAASGDPFGLGDGTDARITLRLTESGLHTILISSADGTAGDYLLRLRNSPAASITLQHEIPTEVE